MKAIIYCRKSTDREDMQVQSLDDQLKFCRDTAQALGYEVVEEITESMSAKNPEKRPGFKKMMKMLGDKADVVITWKVNRLARNPVDQGYVEWYLQEGRIKEIISSDGAFKTGDNVLIIRMYFGMATQYVIDMRKDIMRGMRSKAEKGGLLNKPPRGYSIVNGEAEQNEEAKVIKEIFELRKKGWSMDDIAEEMYKKYQFQTKHGKPVMHTFISKIIENPFYYGAMRWSGEVFNGNHLPIVSKDDWDSVNKVNRGVAPQKHGDTICMGLRGLVKDADNGSILTASIVHDKYVYFHTATRSKRKIYLNQQVILDYFENTTQYLTLPRVMEKPVHEAFQDMLKGKQKDVSSMRAKYTKLEAELVKKKQNLLEMRMNKEVDAEEFFELKNKYTEEIQDLRNQTINLDNLDEDILNKADKILQVCTNLHQIYKSGDLETKIDIIKLVSTNIFVDEQKVFTIQFNPFYEAIIEVNKNPQVYGDSSGMTEWWTRVSKGGTSPLTRMVQFIRQETTRIDAYHEIERKYGHLYSK